MEKENALFGSLQGLQLATLAWESEQPVMSAGRFLGMDHACLSCVAKSCLEAGVTVVLSIQHDKLRHEFLGRVADCKPTPDGDYVLRLGMEYADLETQALLNHLRPDVCAA